MYRNIGIVMLMIASMTADSDCLLVPLALVAVSALLILKGVKDV